MEIRIASANTQIAACFPVMQQLRPHLEEGAFLDRVRRQQETGYRLAFIAPEESPVAVAGFRMGENLAWGSFLYVDDLVTAAAHRSHGYGAMLLSWLREYATKMGCRQLHLDSGLQREDAHRFYLREGLSRGGYHFVLELG